MVITFNLNSEIKCEGNADGDITVIGHIDNVEVQYIDNHGTCRIVPLTHQQIQELHAFSRTCEEVQVTVE